MKLPTSTFFAIFATILISSMVYPAYANQMTVFLVTDSDKADATFTAIRFITIQYSPGSQLSKQFDGKNERVMFTVNSTEDGMSQLISTVNQVLRTEKQSPVQVENATLDYTASIRGEPDRVALAYKVVLKSNISKFVLERSAEQGTAVDLDWRGLDVKQPMILNTQNYGMINVNYPIGLLQATFPDFAGKLLNSQAKEVMNDPIFTFQEIGAPMERWHFLFDPTGSQAGAAGAGYIEEGGAKVVSIFSLGESSFREGVQSAVEKNAQATIDGTQVSLHASTPPPSGQIQITGFARVAEAGRAGEIAFVSSQAPAGTSTATGGFPIQVLLVLGGMMGAVAIFVLLKARK
jgi:hypothetical protein